MRLNEYQERSKRTLNFENMTRQEAISQMLMGIQGESGEVADLFKKHFFQGHELNEFKVLEELGDTLFYIAGLSTLLNIELGAVAENNIEKLYRRYPDGFDAEKSINREC